MDTFLSEVVSKILKKEHSLTDVLCVLPSERAGVFLKAAFKQQVTTTVFLPEIQSIENFIECVSGLKKMDTISLLFEFYSCYSKKNPEEQDDFDSFSQWASIALKDFNEVDRHLVPASELFSYLKDIKRLENWDVSEVTAPSEVLKNHLSFMERLGTSYQQLYKHLLANKKGYQGMLYREAVQNTQEYLKATPKKHFVFIGFNALNRAEEALFKSLLDQGVASVYWDSDASYMESKKEAGHFLRNIRKQWPYYEKHRFETVSNHFSKDKIIHQIATPKNVSQIKAVGNLLSKQLDFAKTALVLADESLLSLTLNSLPEEVKRLNITMGYLLKDMPIAGFFGALFELYLNQKKLGKVSQNQFYYKDIERLFQHPFLHKLYGDSSVIEELRQLLVANNQVFVSSDQLQGMLSDTEGDSKMAFLFRMSQDVSTFVESCCTLIDANKDNFEGFERECLFRYHTLFQQLATLNGDFKHIQSLKTLHGIYQQLIATEKLSFQGEPLSGLQLMGMLETRVLDFETVIVTSVNEGVLPAGKNENSFVPFDVKKSYGLPTYQEKDAIFSYHFYRLLQRAKNVYLFYNTEMDAYGAGEKSRFLTQLEIDGYKVVKQQWTPIVQTEKEHFLAVEKTPEMIEQLKKIAASGFSPSALSAYVLDPIRYYKQYLLGIKDPETLQETVAANTMGTVVHEVLDHFYKPLTGFFVKEEDLKNMRLKVAETTRHFFSKHYKNGNVETGKNKLIFKVAENFILNFLQAELRLIQGGKTLKIIAVEQKIAAPLQVPGCNFPIQIKGTVDRIDELDGTLRILDYKTGKVEASQLRIGDFEKVTQAYKYTKALQVMLYAFLYSSQNKTVFEKKVQAGIVSFKNMKSGFISMNFSNTRTKDVELTEVRVQEFMEVVKRTLFEIFDPKTPFAETKSKP